MLFLAFHDMFRVMVNCKQSFLSLSPFPYVPQIGKKYVQIMESEYYRDLKQIKLADLVLARVGGRTKVLRPTRAMQTDFYNPTFHLFPAVEQDVIIPAYEEATIYTNWSIMASTDVSLCFEISRFIDLWSHNIDVSVKLSEDESGNIEDRFAENAAIVIRNRENRAYKLSKHCAIIDMEVEALKRHEMYQYRGGLFVPQIAEVSSMKLMDNGRSSSSNSNRKPRVRIVFGKLLKMMH